MSTNGSAIGRTLPRLGIALVFFGTLLQFAPAAAQPLTPNTAPPAGSATPPAGSAAPGAAPPPYMYQEPPATGEQAPGAQPPPTPQPAPPPRYYRRPPPPPYPPPAYPGYVYEPPPPPPMFHRAPYNALWLGARVGALFPFGNAYAIYSDPYYEYGESWSGLASSGPAVEGDLGVRFARRFIIYGFWEHAWLGTGNDPSWRTVGSPPVGPFGDQTSATTDYPGLGFRWSSRPDYTGLVIDVGLGYRWFRETWSSGTKMELQGFGEFRFGFGADIRMNRMLSISPLLMFSSGSFTDREITFPGSGPLPIDSVPGSHGTVTLSIGGHVDFAPSP